MDKHDEIVMNKYKSTSLFVFADSVVSNALSTLRRKSLKTQRFFYSLAYRPH